LPLGEILGRERMFFTVERAVDAYLDRHSPMRANVKERI
jgi:hypothetical protein